MDMLTESELQLAVNRIHRQCDVIGDHLVWQRATGTSAKSQPGLRLYGRNGRRIRCIILLWWHRYGTEVPAITHECEYGLQCLNLDHKSIWSRNPAAKQQHTIEPKKHYRPWTDEETQYLRDNNEMSKEELAQHLQRTPKSIRRKLLELGLTHNDIKYRYQRHTQDCPGPDWVVIDRIVTAGTVNALTNGHVICDCERAYIIVNYERGHAILKINGTTYRNLKQLGETL